MKEVKLKTGKHLLLFEIPSGYSPGEIEALSIQIKNMMGDNFKFIISQAATEITVLSLDD